jgi:DNA replication protein DnaC
MTNTNDLNDSNSLNDLLKYFRFVTSLNEIGEAERKMLHKILREEHSQREIRRIQRLIRLSGIKKIKTLEEFDWMFNPKIPRNEIMEFINSDWVENARNLTLIGPSGVGKTHLASAICYKAAQKGYATVFMSQSIF